MRLTFDPDVCDCSMHSATVQPKLIRTFIVAAIAFIAGCIIMAAAPTYGMLMFGRCFVGLGVGTGLAIDPMYISEVTPAKHRGQLVTWSEIALNVGIVLGFAMSLFLAFMSDDVQWRFMFLLGVILPSVMIYLAINVMPESPRWLVANGQEQAARQVLTRIYPDGYNVNPVIEDIQELIECATLLPMMMQLLLSPPVDCCILHLFWCHLLWWLLSLAPLRCMCDDATPYYCLLRSPLLY